MKISVVIAVRNEAGSIAQCLDAFSAQTIPLSDFEIVVVDGQSSDDTVDIINSYISSHPELTIRLIENPDKNQAAGWNIGFRETDSEYVVMMGAHTIVSKDFLENNLKLHKMHHVPCIGGLVRAHGDGVKSNSIALAFNSPFGSGNAKYWHGEEVQKVETVAFGMYRRDAINGVAPLDEKIVRGQDWEFNYRITKKFGKMLFSPSIKSNYFSRPTFTDLWKRQYRAGYWKIYIIAKHPGSLLLRQLVPFLFVVMLLLSFILAVALDIYFPLVLISLVYGVVNIFYALKLAKGKKKVSAFCISVAFFIMHFAYGLGALVGTMLWLKNSTLRDKEQVSHA